MAITISFRMWHQHKITHSSPNKYDRINKTRSIVRQYTRNVITFMVFEKCFVFLSTWTYEMFWHTFQKEKTTDVNAWDEGNCKIPYMHTHTHTEMKITSIRLIVYASKASCLFLILAPSINKHQKRIPWIDYIICGFRLMRIQWTIIIPWCEHVDASN